MVNEMDKLNKLHNVKTIEYSAQKASRSEKATPKGTVERHFYDNYYDHNDTIVNATAADPNDPENVYDAVNNPLGVYMVEPIFQNLERRAEIVYVANDAAVDGATLFVICSHTDTNQFSRERPIYPQQYKVYYNVFELRLRSTATIAYRVCENELGAL